jgi:hypothetical protein
VDVDQSALTGESLPVTLRGGDAAQMGATVVRGEVHATGDSPAMLSGWRLWLGACMGSCQHACSHAERSSCG